MENNKEFEAKNLANQDEAETKIGPASLIDTNYSPEEIVKIKEIITQQSFEISCLSAMHDDLSLDLAEAKKHAFEDKLTGCFNINYYNKYKKENFNPKTDQGKIAVVYIDANGLKEINDTPIELGGGHDAGDQMIVNISKYLKRNVREEDTVIRPYGFGDEFIILIRNSTNDGYFEEYVNFRMDTIREAAKKKKPSLDFATGVAVFHSSTNNGREDATLDDTKKRAEQGMYHTKRNMKKKTTSPETQK